MALNYILVGCPWHVGNFFLNRNCFNRASRSFENWKGKIWKLYAFFLLYSQPCSLIWLFFQKASKGFWLNRKAIDKQIIFIKYNSTANSQRLSYKCEEDHHSNYGRNFGSCKKKHLIFREWNLSRELCDADNQLFSQEPTGQLGSYNSLYLFHLFPGFR